MAVIHHFIIKKLSYIMRSSAIDFKCHDKGNVSDFFTYSPPASSPGSPLFLMLGLPHRVRKGVSIGPRSVRASRGTKKTPSPLIFEINYKGGGEG